MLVSNIVHVNKHFGKQIQMTGRRTEREDFFNESIIGLLHTSPTTLILAGDFNCVLNTSDSTGQRTCSRALARLFTGHRIEDAWDSETYQQHAYTHYTPLSAARIHTLHARISSTHTHTARPYQQHV